MSLDVVSIAAVALLSVTSVILLISLHWRVSMIALAVQYLAVFWLVALVWSINLAMAKLVTGWMVIAIIAASQPVQNYQDRRFAGLPGILIKLLSTVLIGVLVYSIAPALSEIIPTGMSILWGGLILIGMGLLQLGFSMRVSRIMLGLLTLLAGFEVIYAAVEDSMLVEGLLVIINLGLGLVCSYLLSVATLEAE
jgi:hypothetical protein